MLGALRILLGPVLLWQGKAVRRDILRLPEPDGPRAGQAGEGPGLSLLLLGDSAAAGVGVTTQDKALSGRLVSRLSAQNALQWRLEAKTGWTTADALAACKQLEASDWDVVLVSVGVNDVTTEVRPHDWLAHYDQIIEHLRVHCATRLILVSAIPPMGKFTALPRPLRWYLGLRAAEMDRALQRWARDKSGVIYLPFDQDLQPGQMAEDGFHPGPDIYSAWADRAADVILSEEEHLPRAASRMPVPDTRP